MTVLGMGESALYWRAFIRTRSRQTNRSKFRRQLKFGAQAKQQWEVVSFNAALFLTPAGMTLWQTRTLPSSFVLCLGSG